MSLRYPAAVALTALLALPVAGHAADNRPLWNDATPATIDVTGGTSTTVTVAATSPDPKAVVHISAFAVPSFVAITATDGNPGTATLTITPSPALHRRFVVTLEATTTGGTASARTLTLVVTPDMRPASLVGPGAQSRWAYVLAKVPARAAPRSSARRVATLTTGTPLARPNLVLLRQQQRDMNGRMWVQVLLPVLPNGTTGWVRREALDKFQVVRTHLVIDRSSLRAYLYRDGIEIFNAVIGVGRAGAPTPAGEFYIREQLRNFGDAFYGPVAFGTSGRSPVLTDWPGGGFIGIHGTNMPQLLPGRVSHGCVRMRNTDILRLARLMPLGTPVTIR